MLEGLINLQISWNIYQKYMKTSAVSIFLHTIYLKRRCGALLTSMLKFEKRYYVFQ
jgi:hypothetical protein